MHHNRQFAETFESRARRTLRQSYQLLHQSYALRAETQLLLDRFEQRAELNSYGVISNRPDFLGNYDAIVNWAVDAALMITNADMANLQLFDPNSKALLIAAQSGFGAPFLDYFGRVHEGEAACGEALRNRQRIVVEDVTESPVFRGKPALEVLLDAKVRAVQSTPLIGVSGSMLGVLSTHWSSPRQLSARDLFQLDLLARTVANCLEYLHLSK
jgi:GAF domain-containing protein